MARAPFQVLVYPYRQAAGNHLEYALFRRMDNDTWQGVSGGGEDDETPLQAAQREAAEEANVPAGAEFIPLDTTESVPVTEFRGDHRWANEQYVIPQYAFGVNMQDRPIALSEEHSEVRWLSYRTAREMLRYDGNRVALWELDVRLRGDGPRAPRPPENERPGPEKDVLTLLEDLRAIARDGLHFASDFYDRERYGKLMNLTTQAYASLLGAPAESVAARLLADVAPVTPKVGADAAIFNERDEILLMERTDGRGWCMPCGWLALNESTAQAAVREAREETGLEVEIEQLVGVFARQASADQGLHSMVVAVYLCRVLGGELTLSHEGLDLRYWPLDQAPTLLPNHKRYAEAALRAWQARKQGNVLPAVFE